MKLVLPFIIPLLMMMFSHPCHAHEQEVSADSLEILASRPDFIRVSLLYITPGTALYSAAGHSAMRMECPTYGFDYCFTFENRPSVNIVYSFLKGDIKAHYQVHKTIDFVDKFRVQGRGMYAVELNLLPKEKQELWRFFDNEVEKNGDWTYDYLSSNCSSMMIHAINSCLQSERLEYHDVTPWLQGSNRYILQEIFRQSPWVELFWNMVLGVEGEQTGNQEGCMAPKFLFDEIQKASFKGDENNVRQAVSHPAECLLQATRDDKPNPFTPNIFCIAMFVLAALVTVCDFGLKRRNPLVSRAIDAFFMTIATIIGIAYLYLILFSTQVGTSWNWLVLVFNPLLFLLWLCLRKKERLMKSVYYASTVILLLLIAATPLLPQLQTSPLAWLVLAFAVRTFANAKNV